MYRSQQAQSYYNYVSFLCSYYLLLLKANLDQFSETKEEIIPTKEIKDKDKDKNEDNVLNLEEDSPSPFQKETEAIKEVSQPPFQIKPEQHQVEKPLSSRDLERKSEKVPPKQPSPIQVRNSKTPSRVNPQIKPVHQSSPSPQPRKLTRKDQPHPPEDVPQDPQVLSQSVHKRFASQDYTQVINMMNKQQKISFETKLKIQQEQKQKEREQAMANQTQKSTNLRLKQQKTVSDEKTTSLLDSLFNQRDTSALRSVQKYKQSRNANRPNSFAINALVNKQQTNEKSPSQSVKNSSKKRNQTIRHSMDYDNQQVEASKEIKVINQEENESFTHANTVDFAKKQQEANNGIMQDLKVHKGPFDIGSVSTKAVNILIQEMYKVLELYKILYKKNGKWGVSCSKQNIKFDIEICRLEKPETFNYVKVKKEQGDSLAFQNLMITLLNAMHL